LKEIRHVRRNRGWCPLRWFTDRYVADPQGLMNFDDQNR
jgi:hypothetical protein